MMSVYRWDHSAGWAAADRLPESAAEVAADQVVWVDLSDPTAEEEEAVFGRFLKVHPLTREDITKSRREPDQGAHFPKVEEFADYLFVIVNPPAADRLDPKGRRPRGAAARPVALQLSAVLSHGALVPHRRSDGFSRGSVPDARCVDAAVAVTVAER